jgi:hypothetical protein
MEDSFCCFRVIYDKMIIQQVSSPRCDVVMSNKRRKTSSVASNAQHSGAGIQSMPHELLLEILQYLGPPLDRTGYFGGTPPYPLNSERRQTLHSLSQCCRALRSFFLPLAWEYVDACRAKNGHGECDWTQMRKRQRNLELKSRGLVQNPNLAAYVRYESICRYFS